MTKTELANLVMDILGVNAPGEELEGVHVDKSNAEYLNVLGELRTRRLVTWPEENIPDVISRPVALMVADGLGLDYGIEPNKRAEIRSKIDMPRDPRSAISRLRRYARKVAPRTPGEFTHY